MFLQWSKTPALITINWIILAAGIRLFLTGLIAFLDKCLIILKNKFCYRKKKRNLKVNPE